MAYEKMNLLNIPNIPKKRVRLALVDGRISSALEEDWPKGNRDCKDRGLSVVVSGYFLPSRCCISPLGRKSDGICTEQVPLL